MATTSEIQELIIQVTNGQKIDDLKTQIAAEEVTLQQLNEALRTNGTLTAAQQRAQQAAAGAMADHQRQLGELTRRTGNSAYAMRDLGRVTQDFAQGGLGGILNNIEGLTTSLGGSAGLAGMLTIVGTAFLVLKPYINQAVEQFKDLWKEVDFGKDVLERTKERIDEINKHPVKLAVDRAEVDRLKEDIAQAAKDLAALKKTAELTTDYQQESGGLASKLFAEVPGGAKSMTSRIAASIHGELETSSGPLAEARAAQQAAAAKIAKLQRDLDRPGHMGNEAAAIATEIEIQKHYRTKAEEKARNIQMDLRKEANRKAGELFEGTYQGKDLAQRKLADRLRKIGMGQTAGDLEGQSPAALKAYDEEVKDFDAPNESAKGARERRTARRQHADKITSELNATGKFNEAGALDELHKLEAQRKGLREQGHRQIRLENQHENTAIKDSGIDTMAEGLLAQVRAQGGAHDAAGRFHRMDSEQQFAFVQSRVAQWLHRVVGQDQYGRDARANRGMSRDATADLATRITAAGNKQLGEQMVALSGQGLTQQQQLIQIAQATAGQISALMIAQRQQQMAIQQLGRKTQQNGRTNMNGGPVK